MLLLKANTIIKTTNVCELLYINTYRWVCECIFAFKSLTNVFSVEQLQVCPQANEGL